MFFNVESHCIIRCRLRKLSSPTKTGLARAYAYLLVASPPQHG